jgi:hypothetical protein
MPTGMRCPVEIAACLSSVKGETNFSRVPLRESYLHRPGQWKWAALNAIRTVSEVAQCLFPGCAETQDEASDEVRASGRRHRSAKVNTEGRAVEMSITSAAMYSRIPDIKQLKFEAKLSKWTDQNCEEVISRCDQEELLTHILSGSCSGRALSSRR